MFDQTWWNNNLKNRYNEYLQWLGDESSESRIFIKQYIKDNNIKSIVDFGCGPAIKFINIKFNDNFLNPENMSSCIIRDDFPGFKEDYITVHLLIKKYKPFNIIEIGTNSGIGTNIICNAMEGNPVFSIDLPKEYDMSIIYNTENPEDGRPKNVGECCKFSYTQLWGNSKDFNFSNYYPLDAWFIDGKHNYEYVINDTNNAMKADSKLIIWHDV